jgi:hypothetical protein
MKQLEIVLESFEPKINLDPKIQGLGNFITQDTQSDIKFQDIIYYSWNGKKEIKSDSNIKIDFIGAMNEMKNLDYTFDKNFIGFKNLKNNNLVQFSRIQEDSWYADIPINAGYNWDGYYWAGYSNTETIANMLKLFFEEVSWFDSISWVMRRDKQ